MKPPETLYQIAAVARMTGLSADVIRSWERRHGLIVPRRDPAGIRLYSEAEVAHLKLLRQAAERGHPIRRIAAMADEELAVLGGGDPDRTRLEAPSADVPTQLIANVLAALREGDAGRAEQLLVSAALLMETKRLVLDVLAPLMRNVGVLWHDGLLPIWQEHLLSDIVRSVSEMLLRSRRAAPGERNMLFATPPFELHEFGSTFASILAVASGVHTLNLGRSVPPAELVVAARRLAARYVVVGITRTDFPDGELLNFATDLVDALPRRTSVWLGGAASTAFVRQLAPGRVKAVPTLEAFAKALEAL